MKTLKITPENYEQYKNTFIGFDGNIEFQGIDLIECRGIKTSGGSIYTYGGSIKTNRGSIFTNGGSIKTNGGLINNKKI